MPVARMAPAPQRRTRRVRRWAWRRSGAGRPRLADRVGGDQRRVEGAAAPAAGDEPLEPAGGGELVVGQEQADVELGTGLDLDPAHPLAVQEDRRQSQPAPVLGHHLGGGARRWRRTRCPGWSARTGRWPR